MSQKIKDLYNEMSDRWKKLNGEMGEAHANHDYTKAVVLNKQKEELNFWQMKLKPLFLDFAADVLAESKSVPVIVDFYSDTCRPCIELFPLLKMFSEKEKIPLVKINTHEEIGLSRQYSVRSIPRILIFFQGIVVWDNQNNPEGNIFGPPIILALKKQIDYLIKSK